MKLFLKMAAIASGHIGVLLIVYGKRWLAYLPPTYRDWLAIFAWILLPACAAFCLYYSSLAGAGLFTAPFRRGKLAMWSAAATFFSLYSSMFLCLNTYGS
jgi:TRAP-type C4-dicarboxylate transport system permease small subunit